MKCLVTGGAGFIGSNLAETLLAEGNEVVILDDFSMGKMHNISGIKNKITLIKGDLRDEKSVFRAAKGCDVIFNEAAASSSPMFMKELRKSVAINTDGFINILHAAIKYNSKLVYASTSSVYANNKGSLKEDMQVTPPNFYSVTKLVNEHLAYLFSREYGLQTIGFRYMSVYGPHENGKGIYANMATQFLWEMLNGKAPIIFGDGRQTRDFVYVADVVRANIQAANSKVGGEVVNIGTGSATSLNELVRKINTVLGTNMQPQYAENNVKMYIYTQKAEIKKAQKLLNWEPKVGLDEGLKRIAEHYKNGGA
ncbi:MAG: SDR family NAD(P)-dependent oxidoreductase [Candidatus Aenigmarchaeota archaeon]|nr:SDR family NAD(P)-dependent oxidoreductase [Candidatus Aenigmarchaeota archaeon]